LCGRLLNFGAFATPERHIIFDINDFDETLPAPWGVKRLAASFVIASAITGLTARSNSPLFRRFLSGCAQQIVGNFSSLCNKRLYTNFRQSF
jgi:uncharacterized protein (DUF2252 family)